MTAFKEIIEEIMRAVEEDAREKVKKFKETYDVGEGGLDREDIMDLTEEALEEYLGSIRTELDAKGAIGDIALEIWIEEDEDKE